MMTEEPKRTLTLAVIAAEAAERAIERGDLWRTDEDLDIAHDVWVQLINDANMAAAQWGVATLDSSSSPITFYGPTGKITFRPDADLPAGTWKWRDKNPFARWFPEART
jgi:hypothetical protein